MLWDMQGVTTAIVGFIFVCIVWPQLVKNKPQYYAALATVLITIILDALARLFTGSGTPGAIATFAYVATGFLQVVAIFLLVLATGGLSARELAGEIKGAYEVIRRGEEEKEIIIPIRSQMQNPPPAAAASTRSAPEEERRVYTIDEAGNEIPAPPKKDDEGDKGIPLA